MGVPAIRISPEVGGSKPGDHPERRGLARAGRAEQREELARRAMSSDRSSTAAKSPNRLVSRRSSRIGIREGLVPTGELVEVEGAVEGSGHWGEMSLSPSANERGAVPPGPGRESPE